MSFVPIYHGRVVISSSWREIFPFEVIPPLFSPDIAIRIIGFTPFLNPKNIHQHKYLRHQEVREYLRQNQAENSAWVALTIFPNTIRQIRQLWLLMITMVLTRTQQRYFQNI